MERDPLLEQQVWQTLSQGLNRHLARKGTALLGWPRPRGLGDSTLPAWGWGAVALCTVAERPENALLRTQNLCPTWTCFPSEREPVCPHRELYGNIVFYLQLSKAARDRLSLGGEGTDRSTPLQRRGWLPMQHRWLSDTLGKSEVHTEAPHSRALWPRQSLHRPQRHCLQGSSKGTQRDRGNSSRCSVSPVLVMAGSYLTLLQKLRLYNTKELFCVELY